MQRDPLITYSEIANYLHVTPKTAKKKVEKLMDRDNPLIYNVSGQLNHKKIGLLNQTYFLDLTDVDVKRSFGLLHTYGMSHPYTLYQNRIYGSINGMIMQFLVPFGQENEFDRNMELLRTSGIIATYTKFENPERSLETFPNFAFWNDDGWNFDFMDWYNTTSSSNADESESDNISDQLRTMDLIIMRELMINARRKQVDIANDIASDTSGAYSKEEKELFHQSHQRAISRRFDFIRHNDLINGYQLLFNRKKFHLINQIALFGVMSEDTRKSLFGKLASEFPFRSSFRAHQSNPNNFFWWTHLPPTNTSDFLDFVFSVSQELNMVLFDTSDKYSLSFPVWHRNLVTDGGISRWRIGSDWLGREFTARFIETHQMN